MRNIDRRGTASNFLTLTWYIRRDKERPRGHCRILRLWWSQQGSICHHRTAPHWDYPDQWWSLQGNNSPRCTARCQLKWWSLQCNNSPRCTARCLAESWSLRDNNSPRSTARFHLVPKIPTSRIYLQGTANNCPHYSYTHQDNYRPYRMCNSGRCKSPDRTERSTTAFVWQPSDGRCPSRRCPQTCEGGALVPFSNLQRASRCSLLFNASSFAVRSV
jgi:hypothetical protein